MAPTFIMILGGWGDGRTDRMSRSEAGDLDLFSSLSCFFFLESPLLAWSWPCSFFFLL